MRTYVITGSWERSADPPVCTVDFIVGLEPWEEVADLGLEMLVEGGTGEG